MRYALLITLALFPTAAAAQGDSVGNVFLFQEVEIRPRLRAGSVIYYPRDSDSTEGIVTAVVVIDSTGRVAPNSIRVLRSPSPAFTAAARAMLLGQAYSPGKVHGQHVSVLMQQDIRFRAGSVSCATVVSFEGTALCADSTRSGR